MNILPKHSASDITIFTEMTLLANQHKAVNLAQGFPDYDIDPLLKKTLSMATEKNYNQYAPLAGNPLLIENLQTFNAQRKNPIIFEKDQITITPGATYAIYTCLATILQPGDEVIILEPAYDCYLPAIQTNGGKPVFVALDDHFEVDWEKLKLSISQNTKAIIVNTPHNPSGKIWTLADWEKLWQLIKDKDIIVISDEVYDLLTYDHHSFCSAQHHPEISKRSFSLFSFGKMFHITGWKVGYIISNPAFMQAFRKVHQYLTFCVNAPAQQALADYLPVFDAEKNKKMIQEKRDFFLSEIQHLPFQIHSSAEGSYFQILGYQNISNLSDKDFAIWLTKEHKVATIPVSAFFHDLKNTNTIRFCFAKKEETILQAIKNLKQL